VKLTSGLVPLAPCAVVVRATSPQVFTGTMGGGVFRAQ